MAFEKVKLTDLPDNEIVSYEDATYVLTVSEFKEELKKDDDVLNKTWYVAKSQTWQPDARYMLDNYIENEYQELYEDWDERANDCITDEVVNQIQAILDKAFNDDSVKNYWTLEKQIEI